MKPRKFFARQDDDNSGDISLYKNLKLAKARADLDTETVAMFNSSDTEHTFGKRALAKLLNDEIVEVSVSLS